MSPENQSAQFVGKAAAETPPERVERQIRELKSRGKFAEDFGYHREVPTADGYEVQEVWEERIIASSWGELSEARKLEQLATLDWQGVPPLERLCVIQEEIDLYRVSPSIQRLYLGEVREQAIQAIHGGQMPSLIAAILADPAAFLPASGPSTDHDHGPERGR